MKILAIETSCDETAAAILEFRSGGFRIISSAVVSSVKWQAKYGGIVPEVAARKQMEFVVPIIESVLKETIGGLDKNELRIKNYESSKFIDYIAVTNGPGLITSLRVGVEAAKTLSYIWKKPLLAVNHLEGHIYSALLAAKQNNFQFPISNFQNKKDVGFNKLWEIKFPVLALVVSGGHTELVLMKDYLKYKIIGQTRDDAVGEAFDKVAKILNLGYPGGPIISKLAERGDASKIELPRPMVNSGDYNFSFSGIKTAVWYETLEHKNIKTLKQKRDLCASFQKVCVDVLVKKTIKAAEEFGVTTILLGGGVAANGRLRQRLGEEINRVNKVNRQVELLMPDLSLTGDNAVMIALAGYYRIKKVSNQKNKKASWKNIKVDPNLELK